MRNALAILATISIVATQALSQARPPSPPKENKASVETTRTARMLALRRTRELVSSIEEMQDSAARSASLSAIADLVWDDDRPFARELFQKALDICATSTSKNVAFEYGEVFAHLAKRDGAWVANALIGLSPSLRRMLAPSTATFLLESNTDAALDVIESNYGDRDLTSAVLILRKLRQRDTNAADSAYLRLLDRLRAQPQVDLLTLTLAGTYVFTHYLSPSFSEESAVQTIIGGVNMYDIRMDRPQMPRGLVRSYLDAASHILTREGMTASPSEKYVVASILRAKAESHAPELAVRFTAVQQAVANETRADVLNLPSQALLQQPNRTQSIQSSQNVWERSDPTDSKGWRLMYAHDHLLHGDFETARSAGEKIANSSVRSRFLTLVDFYEAGKLIEDKKPIVQVERLVRRLSPGVETALLWLRLSQLHRKAHDDAAAHDAVSAALKAAEVSEDVAQPHLLMAAAAIAAELDPEYGASTAREAVRRFNRPSMDQTGRYSWSVTLGVAPITRTFGLKVAGVDTSIESTWKALAKLDLEGTLLTVKSIDPEKLRARSLVAMVEILLSTPKAEGPK